MSVLDIGQILVIDRATRAIAARFEVFLDRTTAQEWLQQAPNYLDRSRISWGHLSFEQIDGLFDLTGDDEGRALLQEGMAKLTGRDTFFSLFWCLDEVW